VKRRRPVIGIIGYGRFGKVAAQLCARVATVYVYDPHLRPGGVKRSGITVKKLHEVASQDVVILAVPVSALVAILRNIAPHVRPGSLIVDVCAVKVWPVRWMKQLLPEHVSIIGSHPLFGPDTAHGSVAGHRVVLVPVRVSMSSFRTAVRLLRSHGLVVEVMDPENHDRMIAHTLLVTQFVGRMVGKARLPVWTGSTRTYETLRGLVGVAERDSEQLLVDMWRFNPYAVRVSRALLRSHLTLLHRIGRR
jgi:prephenate dehydrogenase